MPFKIKYQQLISAYCGKIFQSKHRSSAGRLEKNYVCQGLEETSFLCQQLVSHNLLREGQGGLTLASEHEKVGLYTV